VKLFRTLIGLTVTLLLVLVILNDMTWAKAVEPRMDYWYIETLKLDGVELPAGVVISASDPTMQPRANFVLENQNATPVYVMSLNYKDVLVMTTPDPNWKRRVDGAHEAASYLAAPGRTVTLDMVSLSDLDKRLVDRNVLSSDPPPENLPVPAAQSSELLLVYREQVIEVPFSLSYSLNTNFGNGAAAYAESSPTIQATGATTATPTPHGRTAVEWIMNEKWLICGSLAAILMIFGFWGMWTSFDRDRRES
jgi:hypothetical protein